MSAWRLRPGVVAAGLLPEGRVDVSEIAGVVRPLFGDAWPARALWLCAVRLSDGHRIAFGREGAPRTDVATAVQASCAIPGWFAPVTIAGQRYVDGGAHSPTNADLLRRDPPELVIVVSPMSAERGGNPLRRWHAVTLAREVAALKRAGADVVTFEPSRADLDVMGVNAMDPSRRAAVARTARDSAAARLAKYPLVIPGLGGRR